MASREIAALAHDVQILYNRFYDRCRRDVSLLKRGVTVMLTCSYRSPEEQEMLHLSRKAKICVRGTDGKPSSRGFEVMVFEHCRPASHPVPEIAAHAASLGLAQPELYYYEAP